MTDKTEAQPEALRLAAQYDHGDPVAHGNLWKTKVCNELRRQHDELNELKAQLTTQTNRAAAAEQQVTALTQRLDMANRLNTDARDQLPQLLADQDSKNLISKQDSGESVSDKAQLSARQAAPDGWRLVPVKVAEEMHIAAVKVLHRATGVDGLPQRMLDAMLSAAPPPPEREPKKGALDD